MKDYEITVPPADLTEVELTLQIVWLNNIDCPSSNFDGNFYTFFVDMMVTA